MCGFFPTTNISKFVEKLKETKHFAIYVEQLNAIQLVDDDFLLERTLDSDWVDGVIYLGEHASFKLLRLPGQEVYHQLIEHAPSIKDYFSAHVSYIEVFSNLYGTDPEFFEKVLNCF